MRRWSDTKIDQRREENRWQQGANQIKQLIQGQESFQATHSGCCSGGPVSQF
jgi:hypothetical protein